MPILALLPMLCVCENPKCLRDIILCSHQVLHKLTVISFTMNFISKKINHQHFTPEWRRSKILNFKPGWHNSVDTASAWSHTVRQQHNRSWFGAPPMPAHKYVEENGLVAMLTKKRWAGVTPDCRKCVTHAPPPTSLFETQNRLSVAHNHVLQNLKQKYWTLFLFQVLRVASVECESVEALQEKTARDPVYQARNASYKVSRNWVFLKWLSLNSANSVNHDKIHEQYGYQKHSTADNRYIPWCSGKKISPTICRLVSI